MNKYLLATAAALLLSVGSASADSTFLIKLDGLPNAAPNTFVITHQTGSSVANPSVTYSAVQKSNGAAVAIGAGMAAVTKEWGNSVVMGFSQIGGQTCYVFQRPFVTGASWEAYYTKDGTTMHEFGHGTYTVATVHQ